MENPIVVTVGQNAYGELILSDDVERHTFSLVTQIKDLKMKVKQIAAGNELTLILTDQGDVWYSGYTQLNIANDN